MEDIQRVKESSIPETLFFLVKTDTVIGYQSQGDATSSCKQHPESQWVPTVSVLQLDQSAHAQIFIYLFLF